MSISRPIDELLQKLQDYINKTGGARVLNLSVEKLVRKVKLNSVTEFSKGFCMKFGLPKEEVLGLFDAVDSFSRDQITVAFMTQWGIPSGALMYGDLYYHNLSLLFAYALKNNNELLAKNALILMMIKLWNGRLVGRIPFCNEDVMQYVTTQMMNNKSLPHKYSNPFEMITDHFVPTIYTKYKQIVISDSTNTKVVFNQSYSRLRQLFSSDGVVDPVTGQIRYRSGLQSLYFKAKDQGFKFSTIKAVADDDGMSADTGLSSSGFDEDIENVTNYVVMNISPKYDHKFIEFVNSESTIKTDTIVKMVTIIHSYKYVDHVREVVELIFAKLSDVPRQKFCSPSFLTEIIKRRIISSKHNQDIIRIKDSIDGFLTDILNENFDKKYNYSIWSNTQKSQWRRIILYAVGYNIQRQLCFN